MDTYHPDEAAVDADKVRFIMNGFVTEQETIFNNTNLTRAAEAINYNKQEDIPM
jgi:hypothetical protein